MYMPIVLQKEINSSMFIFDNKMEQQPPLTKLRKTIGSTLMNNMQVYFQADFRLVDKISLLVPLEAVQACCYVEKKSKVP